MKGYWIIIATEVSDQDAQGEYGKLWKPIAEKYQARIKPSQVPPMLIEAWDARSVIIVEFPSYEVAKACYDDPAYEEARQFALQASNRELLILQGEIA
jgi:uncharacterized protein (DUF1330 family)